MRLLLMLGLGALLSLTTGCATAIRGDRQKITFSTEPEGATVKVDDQSYTSPVDVRLKRKDVHQVTIAKDGFQTITFAMRAQWDGASLGNAIMPGGSVGAATDRADGADLAFYPLPKIVLKPATSSEAGKPVLMFQYRGGKLLTQSEYDAAVAEDRKEAFENRE